MSVDTTRRSLIFANFAGNHFTERIGCNNMNKNVMPLKKRHLLRLERD
jgi:hypothetical protein